MLKLVDLTNLWDRALNVHDGEWSRLAFAWFLRFFYRFTFVVLWTLTMGHFVSLYGISSLPYLFVFVAVFTILGSLFFSTFVSSISTVAILYLLPSLNFLTLALTLYFFDYSSVYFLGALVVAIALFLNQHRLALSAYLEEFFTPVQSERLFPVVESADTIAGITGGVTLVYLLDAYGIDSVVASACVSMLIPIVILLFFSRKLSLHRVLSAEDHSASGLLSCFKAVESSSVYLKYFKYLALVVFFNWFVFNVLEFIYTEAVYSNLESVVSDFGSGFEHAFIHDLGKLFAVFSSLALAFQLFIGSRIIVSLGIINSMFFHILLLFFGSVSFFFGLNFYSALFVKNNFTVTSVVFNNAYHCSYYVIKDGLRKQIREFLEGIVRPLGALAGTLFLIISQEFLPQDIRSYFLIVVLIIVSIVGLSYLASLRGIYTRVAVSNLMGSAPNDHDKFDSLDILSQSGHKRNHNILSSIVLDSSQDLKTRRSALSSLVHINDARSFTLVMENLSRLDVSLQRFALLELSSLPFQKFSSLTLSDQYDFISAVKDVFDDLDSDDDKISLMRLCSHFPAPMTLEFLLNIIESDHLRLRIEALRVIGGYTDSKLERYVRPFLSSDVDEERISAAIACVKLSSSKDSSRELIEEFLVSNDPGKMALGIYAVGELKMRSKLKFLKQALDSKSSNVKLHAAIALGSLGKSSGLKLLIELLLSPNIDMSKRARSLVQFMHPVVVRELNKMLAPRANKLISDLLDDHSVAANVKMKRIEWLHYLIGASASSNFKLNKV